MIAWMLEIMVSVTLLMIMVLAVRRPVAELFGAQWAYALWLLPVIVPFLPPIPNLLPIAAAPMTIIIPEMPIQAAAAAASPASDGGSADLLLMLLALWAGGAIVFAVWQQSTYSAFMLHLGPQGRSAQPPSFGGIPVVESDAVEGPVAIGLIKRRIVVPLDFHARYSETERRLALEHELVHHRRFDLLWNWIGLGLLTINWFNPIVHIAFRAFRADQELSCDAAVTRRAPAQRHDYACALVKSASQPGLIAVCPLNHADMLKRRLRMMKKHRASWARTAGGAAALGVLGVAAAAVATPSFAHEERASANVIMGTKDRDPIIARKEIEVLREKCGGGEQRGSAIVCSDEESRDPEVRAIVDQTMKRAKVRVDQAMPSKKELARIRKQAERVRVQVQAIDLDRHMDEARKAMEQSKIVMIERNEHMEHAARAMAQARVQLAHVDAEKIRRNALRSALGGRRVHIVHRGMSPEDMGRLRADMEALKKELSEMNVELEADMREMREELERELGPLRDRT